MSESNQFFEDLKEAAEGMIAIEKGESIPDPSRVHMTHVPDVKAIRKKTGLSQSNFSKKFGFGLRQIQQWEAGRRHPVGPLVHFLALIDKQPEVVAQVVAEDEKLMEG
jgi:putative transcriptional regulator